MTILVTGGSKNGKSGIAEGLFSDFPGEKYYIATMKRDGEEALSRIASHRAMREGKGFYTIEREADFSGLPLSEGCGVLVECVGNLAANIMFGEDGVSKSAEEVCAGVCGELSSLTGRCELLVIVTNEVGSDGRRYDEGTKEYIKAMGLINQKLTQMSQIAIEAVCGIPVYLKGGPEC